MQIKKIPRERCGKYNCDVCGSCATYENVPFKEWAAFFCQCCLRSVYRVIGEAIEDQKMDKIFTVTKSEFVHLLQKHKDISYLDTLNIEYDKEKETFVCTCVRKCYEPINRFWILVTPTAIERRIPQDMPIQSMSIYPASKKVVLRHKNGTYCNCSIDDIIAYTTDEFMTLTPHQCMRIFGEIPK